MGLKDPLQCVKWALKTPCNVLVINQQIFKDECGPETRQNCPSNRYKSKIQMGLKDPLKP